MSKTLSERWAEQLANPRLPDPRIEKLVDALADEYLALDLLEALTDDLGPVQ